MQCHIHHWKALTLRIPEWYVFKWVTPENLEKLAFSWNPLMIFALSHAPYIQSISIFLSVHCSEFFEALNASYIVITVLDTCQKIHIDLKK